MPSFIEPLERRTHFDVAPSFIDLTDTVTLLAPASGQVLPGKPYTYAVDVKNAGNTLASGPLTVDLSTTPSGDGSSPVLAGFVTKHIHLEPNADVVIRVTKKFPVGTTPAPYFGLASIDPNNTFNESDITNNSALTSTPLTVLNPYPNILATYSGPGVVKKGVHKGARITLSFTFNSEDGSNGDILADGVDTSNQGVTDFHFQGTITTKGVFLGTTVTSSFKGKLVGDAIKGTFTNHSDGDVGTFVLTVQRPS